MHIFGSSTLFRSWVRRCKQQKCKRIGKMAHVHSQLPLFLTRHLNNNITPSTLRVEYQKLFKSWNASEMAKKFKQIPDIQNNRIFANNKCNLNYISAFGFDFDFTLANYNKKSGHILYDNAMRYLVSELGYPESLLKYEYDSNFAIRGLQFDKINGNLLKLNQFYKIGLRTVYNGREKLDIETVLNQYGGTRVSEEYFKQNMRTLDNLFSVPEGNIYADVIQTLKNENFAFESEYISNDVRTALDYVHDGGLFHRAIADKPENYVQKQKQLPELIKRLKNENIKLFLLTNSHYSFIDAPCQYIFEETLNELGLSHWTQIFDWSICNAIKPDWFVAKHRFREYDASRRQVKLTSIDDKLKSGGTVYVGGCLEQFTRLTGLPSDSVLYFGDSVHSDLTGPFRSGQWKTCAIVHELDEEIDVNNNEKFRAYLGSLLEVENLIDSAQHLQDNESITIIDKLRGKRNELRENLIASYKTKFGSVFRTHNTRTMFFYRLARYSDLYTSQVVNMINYPLNYNFNGRRQFYDHEPNYWSWPFVPTKNDENSNDNNSDNDSH